MLRSSSARTIVDSNPPPLNSSDAKALHVQAEKDQQKNRGRVQVLQSPAILALPALAFRVPSCSTKKAGQYAPSQPREEVSARNHWANLVSLVSTNGSRFLN